MNPNTDAPRTCAAHANLISPARAAALVALALLASVGALAQPSQQSKTADAQQKADDLKQADEVKRSDEVTTAPPPMRYLPEDVRRQLESESDLKARTRLALDLADGRLAHAAQQADADRFEEATAELGVYEALVADAVSSVQSSGRSKNKQRDILKHVEMTLRSHVPRLETIRRTLPAAFAAYFKSGIEFVNEQRDLALNTFYDDTVLRETARGKDKDKTAVGERAKGDAPAAPDTEKKPERQ